MRKAWGYGVSTVASNGDVLDVWYTDLGLEPLASKSDLTALLAPDHDRAEVR